jgi:uroporphyrinogen-III synthase
VRIALTREHGFNASLYELVPANATVVEVPLTRTVTLTVDAAALAEPDVIVVSSVRACDVALEIITRWPSATVRAVGPKTAAALSDRGVTAAVCDGVREAVRVHVPAHVAVIGARTSTLDDVAPEDIPLGVFIDTIAAYDTVALELDDAATAQLHDCDVVFIGAPSAWHVAREWVRESALVIVPGSTTAEAVSRDHARLVVGWDDRAREALRHG